jgi:hypothetical protein
VPEALQGAAAPTTRRGPVMDPAVDALGMTVDTGSRPMAVIETLPEGAPVASAPTLVAPGLPRRES